MGGGGGGWGGVGHVTVTRELLHGCVDVLLRLGWGVWGGACYRYLLRLDSDWKSLKVWLPNQTKRKQKEAGTAKVNPRLALRCYQWCWRRSTSNPKPNQFLKELAKLFGDADK